MFTSPPARDISGIPCAVASDQRGADSVGSTPHAQQVSTQSFKGRDVGAW